MELEALAAVSDVKASGAGMEADWPTGTWKRLTWRKTGPRRIKTYDVTVYDKSEHRPELIITFVEMPI